ncbi:MAG: hypothetical protein GW779_06130 [Candidatus Altiarchaeum hamiconexum]|uniref:Antitoxin SocA-like Panacea domain-containing protein n=2 Tax=Nanobdellati TaxID=1783276 RepID=A0A2H9QS88_HUBC1|nr:hypothetical protein [Candidatus Altarchaeum hamiconexum]PIV13788.1 MAG: hypothetical protein COS45_00920 [Candidatus Huberarchaeum crystalense]PIZ31067.1 MAG: hypothetical protein COY41_03050 [Candidatus Altarchaeum sp. CG_4_10_14_0_8_um_filter_32_851]PJC14947.1 MAG: hypothetical protein CO063_02155 [Candidatus Altarchaeum sp. CG_4_9_14_0_8_um_filter_32_206]NCS91955.1 hypothetical protein [Candidatus Altarchaeum hamiconexum]
MSEKEELTEIEVIERYIILLLGVVDRPVPSLEHLQKELFILSQANPKIANFIVFEKHYEGPYSVDTADLINNPVYHIGAYQRDREGKSWLTSKGKKDYDNLVKDHSDEPKFKEMLGMMKMIRELYDKLSKEELLFLVYTTYPEYRQKSRISDELLLPQKREEIARRLLEKWIITEGRYKELVKYNG